MPTRPPAVPTCTSPCRGRRTARCLRPCGVSRADTGRILCRRRRGRRSTVARRRSPPATSTPRSRWLDARAPLRPRGRHAWRFALASPGSARATTRPPVGCCDRWRGAATCARPGSALPPPASRPRDAAAPPRRCTRRSRAHVLPDGPGLVAARRRRSSARPDCPGWCGRRRDGGIDRLRRPAPITPTLDGQVLASRRLAAPPAARPAAPVRRRRATCSGSPLDLAALPPRRGLRRRARWRPRAAGPGIPPIRRTRPGSPSVPRPDASGWTIDGRRPVGAGAAAARPPARLRRAGRPARRRPGHAARRRRGRAGPDRQPARSVAGMAQRRGDRARGRRPRCRCAPGRRAAVPVPPLAAVPADRLGAARRRRRPRRRRRVAVVVPVHGGRRLTLACLDAVFATVPPRHRGRRGRRRLARAGAGRRARRAGPQAPHPAAAPRRATAAFRPAPMPACAPPARFPAARTSCC